MNKKQYLAQRLEKLRQLLKKRKVALLLLTNSKNLTYLTGITDISLKEREMYMLISASQAVICVSALRFPDLFLPSLYETVVLRRKVFSETIYRLLEKSKSRAIFFEANDLKVAELQYLRDKIDAEFKSSQDLIEDFRLVKDELEISLIRNACQVSARSWELIKSEIKPGKSEKEIAQQIVEIQTKEGSEGIPEEFFPIVAAGSHSAVPHHVSGASKLEANDVVLVDFGCQIGGYCSDMTRTIQLGKENPEYIKAAATVKQAQAIALQMLKKESTNRDIDFQVNSFLNKKGFAANLLHATGHGLGLDVHEEPQLSKRSGKSIVLKPGMVLAIEPGLYFPGKFGVRHEDSVLLTGDGYEVMTKISTQ